MHIPEEYLHFFPVNVVTFLGNISFDIISIYELFDYAGPSAALLYIKALELSCKL